MPPFSGITSGLAGATLIGGIGSSIANIFGANSASKAAKLNLQAQREANQMNLQIARENNAYNRQNMQLQNDWNLAQWNRENAYNSAAAQAQRYRDAGINPYLAMVGGAQAGTASSISSADAAPASEVGKQLPVDYSMSADAARMKLDAVTNVFQNMSNSADIASRQADVRLKSEQANQLRIENRYRDMEMRAKIDSMLEGMKLSKQHRKNLMGELDRIQIENDFLSDYEVNNARKQDYVQTAYLKSRQAANYDQDVKTKKLLYKYIPSDKAYMYSEAAARTASLYATADLSREEAKKAVADTFLSDLNGKERKALQDNPRFKLYIDGIVKQAYYRGEQGAMDYYMSPFKALGGMVPLLK